MKKVWVLIVVLLLVSACGGPSHTEYGTGTGTGTGNGTGTGSGGGTGTGTGGGGGTGTGTGGGGGTTPPPTTTVAVVINRPAVASNAFMRVISTPTATTARISVTNPNVNGIAYKQIQDFDLSTGITLTMPVASNYTFELLSYETGTPRVMEEYAIDQGVDIVRGSNTVVLTLVPIVATITLPTGTIYTAQVYTVTADYLSSPTTSTPFQSLWRMTAQARTTPYPAPLHNSGVASSTTSLSLKAPVNNNQPGTLYVQAEFYPRTSLLNTGEFYYNWSYVYPNPLWGEAPLSAPLEVDTGTVTIP
jgi:hypothetical protein